MVRTVSDQSYPCWFIPARSCPGSRCPCPSEEADPGQRYIPPDGHAAGQPVNLPAEIDITNAAAVGRELGSACRPGVAVVIADMTQTTFCDSPGVRQLLLASDAAGTCGAELRLVIPSAVV
jgi:hypothetical protein